MANDKIKINQSDVLDNRTRINAQELVAQADLIVIGAGHVPTQNQFLNSIQFDRLIQDFNGVIIGFSAGAMNCAREVYAQSELEGEALSKQYERFLPGIGITQTNVLPHYHYTKDLLIDGKKLFEEITYPDSIGRQFYTLNEDAYIYGDGQHETIYGESYLIQDGSITRVSCHCGTYSIF